MLFQCQIDNDRNLGHLFIQTNERRRASTQLEINLDFRRHLPEKYSSVLLCILDDLGYPKQLKEK